MTGKQIPEGTVALSGNDVTIMFENREEAEKAMSVIESLIYDRTPRPDQAEQLVEALRGLWEAVDSELNDTPLSAAFMRRKNAAKDALAAYEASKGEDQPDPAALVPDHCTSTAFAFEPGVLCVNKDGSGYIAIDEDEFECEDDRCEGPDGPEGSIHWITRMDASEVKALRDFLNGAPQQPDPVAKAVELIHHPMCSRHSGGRCDYDCARDYPQNAPDRIARYLHESLAGLHGSNYIEKLSAGIADILTDYDLSRVAKAVEDGVSAIAASSAIETLTRDDSPFEAADEIDALRAENERMMKEQEDGKAHLAHADAYQKTAMNNLKRAETAEAKLAKTLNALKDIQSKVSASRWDRATEIDRSVIVNEIWWIVEDNRATLNEIAPTPERDR